MQLKVFYNTDIICTLYSTVGDKPKIHPKHHCEWPLLLIRVNSTDTFLLLLYLVKLLIADSRCYAARGSTSAAFIGFLWTADWKAGYAARGSTSATAIGFLWTADWTAGAPRPAGEEKAPRKEIMQEHSLLVGILKLVCLKWQCHENFCIFPPRIQPTWAPDKQAKKVCWKFEKFDSSKY